jgi:hypothetical protein
MARMGSSRRRTSTASASMAAATATPSGSAPAGSSATPSSSGAAAMLPSQPSWPPGRQRLLAGAPPGGLGPPAPRPAGQAERPDLGNAVPHLPTHRLPPDPASGRPLAFPNGGAAQACRGERWPGGVGRGGPGRVSGEGSRSLGRLLGQVGASSTRRTADNHGHQRSVAPCAQDRWASAHGQQDAPSASTPQRPRGSVCRWVGPYWPELACWS